MIRLFKSRNRLDSAEPAERMAAIAAMADSSDSGAPENQAVLCRLVANDPDTGVRLAALERLNDDPTLGELLDDESLGQAAAERVAARLRSGTDTAHGDHPLVVRVRVATDVNLDLIASLKGLGDLNLLIDAALNCPRSLREKLLEDPSLAKVAALQELERRSRDKDKTLNRFARSKLDEIRKLKNHSRELTERAEELLASLLKQADSEPRKRRAIHEQLASHLEELNQAAILLAGFGETVAELDRLNRESAPLAPKQELPIAAASTQIATAPTVDVREQFEALKTSFEALDAALQHDTDFPALQQRRQVLTEQWLSTADHAPPSDAQHAVFERVSHRFQELSSARLRLEAEALPELELPDFPENLSGTDPLPAALWQNIARFRNQLKRASSKVTKIAWPSWAPPSEPYARLLTNVENGLIRLESWQAELRKAELDAGTKLDQLKTQIDEGEVRLARSTANLLRQRLKNLPDQSTLHRALAQESARLSELSDWQTYATTPKREALCEVMEKLSTDPLAPSDQAHRIKLLRAEWNELGPVNRASDHKLQQKFNGLAEQAFEPCRVFFAEQANVRAENLKQREAICQQLQDYLDTADWQHTDYKAAEQIMRAARHEWQDYHPVDRAPGKPLEVRFEELQSRLHTQIKAEWERNLELKRSITREARNLLETEGDMQAKIETAKILQQRWKSVGVTPRRPDQILWREFRLASDELFKNREQAKQLEDQTINTNRQHTQQLIEELKRALDALDIQGQPTNSELKAFQQRYQALDELPERLQRPLNMQFSELTQAYRMMLKEAEAAARQQHLFDLKALDNDVSTQEMQHRSGVDITFEAPDPVFAERWVRVDEEVPLERLRRLVIETEIAAELASPDSDKASRLAIQVELINAGRSRQAFDLEPRSLVDQWCKEGPKNEDTNALRERFFAAIAVLVKG